MTKSYLIPEKNIENYHQSRKHCLIAPKFTIKNFTYELHYYLRIYISDKKPIIKIFMFLFLNAIQRTLYTFGTFLVKIKSNHRN